MKKNLLTILFIVFLFCLGQSAKAEDVPCFDYYKFQSVQVNVGPTQNSFNAGEVINFTGSLINQNRYPIFDGYVFVRISKDNANYENQGFNIKDEFIALGPVAINATSSLPVNFSWTIPNNLEKGEYRADYFFSVSKKYNLGGLPFTNEIIAGNSLFTINSTNTGSIAFDKGNTKVNGEKYNQIGNWPDIEAGKSINIEQKITNNSNKNLTSAIVYDLYFWDSLNEKYLLSSSVETVDLKAGASKVLKYNIPSASRTVYYLNITSQNSDGTKSIINIRTTTPGESPRVNYFGLDKFPLVKGEQANLFTCYHNASNSNTSGKTILVALDRSGKEISKVEYTGSISSDISAEKQILTANKNINYLKLIQKVLDKDGQLVDTQTIIYDAKLLGLEGIVKINPIILYSLVTLIAALFISLFFRKVRKNKIVFSFLSLLAIVILILTIILIDNKEVGAISTITTAGFSSQKTQAVTKDYTIGFPKKRVFAKGSITYNENAIVDATAKDLKIESKINFDISYEGTFNGVGGTWDSPYFDTSLSIDKAEGGNAGSYTFSDPNKNQSPSISSISSSDPSILSCSGTQCVALSAGNVTVRLESLEKKARLKIFEAKGEKDHYGDAWLCNGKNQSTSDNATCASPLTNQTQVFPSQSFVWEFNVLAPDVNGSCGDSNGQTLASAPTTNLCSAGTASSVSDSGSWSWTCTGSGLGSNASCSASKLIKIDGSCGGSNAQTLASAPTTNLCSVGTASSVSGTGPWSWTCAGSGGGASPTCSASKVIVTKIDGSCDNFSNGQSLYSAPTTNLCSAGTPSSVSGTGPWTWTCVGSGGGATLSCSASKTVITKINGSCSGLTNGKTLSSAPTINLCSAGTASSVSGTGPWSWACAGSGGGTTDSCTAYKTIIPPPPVTSGSCNNLTNGQTLASAPTLNLCSAGDPSSVSDTGLSWTWTCVGSGEGDSPTCFANKSTNTVGSCGNLTGQNPFFAPTPNLCSAGDPSSVSDTGLSWTWTCVGSGGNSPECHADKIGIPPPATTTPLPCLGLTPQNYVVKGGDNDIVQKSWTYIANNSGGLNSCEWRCMENTAETRYVKSGNACMRDTVVQQ